MSDNQASETGVISIKEHRKLLNAAEYQADYHARQKAEVIIRLKRIEASRAYRIARIIAKLYGIAIWPASQTKKIYTKYKRYFAIKKAAETRHRLLDEAALIPKSNGVGFYQKSNLNCAIITDEYMYNYYKGAFNNIYWLTPENWRNVFSEKKVDIFLYVSCWAGGLNNEWRGHVRKEGLLREFDSILEVCDRNNIKAVFQTIEDPSNFDHFIGLAKKFPYIFSSDADILYKYRKKCPNSKISHAEYGINPEFNNPIGSFSNKKYDCFFAGSYPRRYSDRCRDMEIIFDCLIKSGAQLLIADRNLNLADKQYRFPAKYLNNILGPIPHELLQAVHKLFAFNVNLNSIKSSSTMCAMRVYELQAQGTRLVSNYARSITNKFPQVSILQNSQNYSNFLKYDDDVLSDEKRVRGIRYVMSGHTVFQQTKKILDTVGLDYTPLKDNKILIVSRYFERQNGIEGLSDLSMTFVDPECFDLRTLKRYNYVAFFNEEIEYEPYYLLDMINAFKYTNCPFVTRENYYNGRNWVSDGVEHDFTSNNPVPYRTVYSIGYDDEALVKHLKTGASLGEGYSCDRFGINYSKYLAKLTGENTGNDKPILSVIIPIHNNGRFLLERCFESLRHNENFSKYELLLIDDCSDDQETLDTIELLEKRFANVRTFRFDDKPSGTASRARNTGIDIASSDVVTFLDPDNAISVNGYDNLLNEYENNIEIDAVIGFQYKITSESSVGIGKLFGARTEIVDSPKQLVIERNFPAISTQAAVIRREFLLKKGIYYIEGAIGQDTTFGYEILLKANKVVFTDCAFIEYFSERANSVTNVIGTNFFSRSLVLEEKQKEILKDEGVWELYKENRSADFVRGWYEKKLKLVNKSEIDQCREILATIREINEVTIETADI